MSEPFIAEIKVSAYNFAPRGWAFCEGQLLPISQNTKLFSLIGTTYGGDGRTTTALPNITDRTAMHPGRGPGLTSRKLGQRLGTQKETLTVSQMPNHNHYWKASKIEAQEFDPSNKRVIAKSKNIGVYTSKAGSLSSMNDKALSNEGSGQKHNNMQPYISMSYIIALVGIFPSRS